MDRFSIAGIFLAATLTCAATPSRAGFSESEMIGRRIYQNECSSQADKLVWWNQGEAFASLGIGHFIWYPQGTKGAFEETFPQLLSFLNENGIPLPGWLKSKRGCPWSRREDFFAPEAAQKREELQKLLAQTISLQALFIEKRLDETLPKILSGINEKKKGHALRQITLLKRSVEGRFALIDYLHFKGDGTKLTERYRGKGWGLSQVLEQMKEDPADPLEEFIKTAKLLLEERVKGSPPERHEEKWLPGWLARVERYRQPST